MFHGKAGKATAICLLLAGAAGSASATTLRITIENTSPNGGLAITPVYTAFHDGSFDAFDQGAVATPGVELLAELGDVSGLPAERLAVAPGSAAVVTAAPANGAPPIEPGETGISEISIDDPVGQRYLTFLSMVVPSNDTFLGNDDPMAFALFDLAGDFSGPFSLDITGSYAYDAGTEVNDPLDGAAFLDGVDMNLGTPENGVITAGLFDLSALAGLQTASGYTVDGNAIDFLDDPDSFVFARLTVEEVAPIPLPATAPLLLVALGALGLGALGLGALGLGALGLGGPGLGALRRARPA